MSEENEPKSVVQFLEGKQAKNISGYCQELTQQKRKILEDFKGANVYDDRGTLRSECRIKKYIDAVVMRINYQWKKEQEEEQIIIIMVI